MERSWTDAEGRRWTVRQEGEKLVFRGGGRMHAIPTERAADLESMDDRELRQIFAAAEEAPTEEGPASPSAVGRESAPHGDPAEHAPPDAD